MVALAKTAGPDWFQKMDRNHDGEVSFREFLGPLEVFRKLDGNHDGHLDAAEAAHKCGGFDLGYLLHPDYPEDQ